MSLAALAVNTPFESKDIFSTFNQRLGLKSFDQVNTYFIAPKVTGIAKIKPLLIITINRLTHLRVCGVWINEKTLGRLINECGFKVNYSGLDEERIKSAVEKILGLNGYKRVLDAAMDESFLESTQNKLIFLWSFIKSPATVGAILPSSQGLAERVVKHIQSSEEGKNYLEVGAGTGIFTREVIRKMGNSDRLDIIEFDKKFCNILRSRFGHLKNVRIHHKSITEWESPLKYDTIISGLPLNAFSSEMVQKIYAKFSEVIKDQGHLSYFEYPMTPPIRKMFTSGKAKEDYQKILDMKKTFYDKYNSKRETVWLNMPYAHACHIQVTNP